MNRPRFFVGTAHLGSMAPGPLDADVVVVGAGPAGTAAAITLARSGRDVILVDKARFPRDKTCGDVLTVAALRQMEQLGLHPSDVPSWRTVDNVVVRSPGGREVTLPLPAGRGTYATVARRFDVDAALVEVAKAEGAKLVDGHACQGVIEHDEVVEVVVDGVGTLQTEWLVAADGVWSKVRKSLGLTEPGYRGDYVAFRQYFAAVAPRAESGLHVWFERDLPFGYVWSFPVGEGGANVGFGLRSSGRRTTARQMATIWSGLLDRPHLRSVLGTSAQPEARHRCWPIPASLDAVPLWSGRRTLFAGDAAATVDPLTGEASARRCSPARQRPRRSSPQDRHLRERATATNVRCSGP